MVSTDDDAALKIVDFGFAAKVKGMSLSKQCGTPGYVAPEILENKLHGESPACKNKLSLYVQYLT